MPVTFEHIERYARELGFAAAGYTAAKELDEEPARYMKSLEAGHFAELGYLERNLEKRFNPQLLVEGAKSVLVFLAPYGTLQNPNDGHIDIAVPKNDGSGAISVAKYKVAQYCLGDDYHTVIKTKLNAILSDMQQKDPSICGRVFTDTAPVLERAWAVRAGLGFIGKNNFLISREHGIRNFIGVIISNWQPEKNHPLTQNNDAPTDLYKKYCGNCTKCLEACPTGALCSPYTIDARKCISYLTIEQKGAAMSSNLELAQERDGWIFGCDACMNACPWNSRNKEGWPEFHQKENPLPISHLKRR